MRGNMNRENKGLGTREIEGGLGRKKKLMWIEEGSTNRDNMKKERDKIKVVNLSLTIEQALTNLLRSGYNELEPILNSRTKLPIPSHYSRSKMEINFSVCWILVFVDKFPIIAMDDIVTPITITCVRTQLSHISNAKQLNFNTSVFMVW